MRRTRTHFTITDTGLVRRLLDDARRRWDHLRFGEIEAERSDGEGRLALVSLRRRPDRDAIGDGEVWR